MNYIASLSTNNCKGCCKSMLKVNKNLTLLPVRSRRILDRYPPSHTSNPLSFDHRTHQSRHVKPTDISYIPIPYCRTGPFRRPRSLANQRNLLTYAACSDHALNKSYLTSPWPLDPSSQSNKLLRNSDHLRRGSTLYCI